MFINKMKRGVIVCKGGDWTLLIQRNGYTVTFLRGSIICKLLPLHAEFQYVINMLYNFDLSDMIPRC